MGNWVINLSFPISSPKSGFLLLPLCFDQTAAVTVKENTLPLLTLGASPLRQVHSTTSDW